MCDATMPSVSDLPVIIYPELAAASVRNNESDLYVVWCILRSIDRFRMGSGRFEHQFVFSLLRQVLGIKESMAYQKIKRGEGLYWNKFGKSSNGAKVTCLIGEEALIRRLSPTSTRSEPFQFFVYDLECDLNSTRNDIKSMMIAVVAARYVKEHPLSIASVAQLTGQSERTVQRAFRDCVDLISYPQRQEISRHPNENEARQALKRSNPSNSAAYKIEQQLSQFVVYRQLPNIYTLTKPKRLPLSKRPKVLREFDVANSFGLQPKKYFHESSKKIVAHEHVKMQGVAMLPSGVVGVWSEQNAKAPVRPRTVSKRWNDIKRTTVLKKSRMNDNKERTNVSA